MAAKQNIFKGILRVFLWTLGVITILIVLTPVMLYIPPIQDFARGIAVREIKKSTGMDIEIGYLRLKWPLRLSANDVCVIQAPGDTMVTAQSLDVGVEIMPLLSGNLNVDYARLEKAFYQLGTADSTLWLRVHIDHAKVDASHLRLSFDSIDVSSAEVDGARVMLILRPDTTTNTDTTASRPIFVHARELRMRNVDYMMQMQPIIDTIRCHVPTATLTEGIVDTGLRLVSARSLSVDSVSAKYFYLPFGSSPTADAAPEPEATEKDERWTVVGQKLHLTATDALYALTGARPSPGLDFDYLAAKDVVIDVNDFYNKGVDIRVPIQQLRATERCGIPVTVTGTFEMKDGMMYAHNFDFTTNTSHLTVDGAMGIGSLTADPALPLRLKGSGLVGLSDFATAFPALRPMITSLPLPRSFNLDADISGTAGKLDVGNLKMKYPGLLDLQASGRVENAFDLAHAGGSVRIDGKLTETRRLKTVQDMLMPNSGIGLTNNLTVKGSVDYHPGEVKADLAATADNGKALIKGSWSGRSESYDLQVNATDLPVAAFVPSLGIDNLTGRLFAKGHGYNPLKASTAIDADIVIDHVTYQKAPFADITFNGSVHGGNIDGTLHSSNPGADLDLRVNAFAVRDTCRWDIDGDIRDLDLRRLRFADKELGGSITLKSTGIYIEHPQSINADIQASNVNLVMDSIRVATPYVDLHAELNDTATVLNLRNGDLLANFSSDCRADSLLPALMRLQPLLVRQIKTNKHIDVDSFQMAIPHFALSINSGTDNLVANYLSHSGITFRQLGLNATNDSTMRLTGRLLGLSTGAFALDTISLTAMQRGKYLIYNANVVNAPGTMDEFAKVSANGYFSDNRLNLLLRQKNINDETGYRFGVVISTADSTLNLSIQPTNAVIAYRDWQVNANNHLTLDFRSRRMNADLALTNETGHIHLFTEPSRIDSVNNTNDLVINMAGVQLKEWLGIYPFLPKLKGELGADLRLNWDRRNITGMGTVSLTDLYLEKQRIGSFDLALDVKNDVSGALRADASLLLDSAKVVTFHGVMNDSTALKPMDLAVDVTHFPLRAINPLLPAELGSLKGYLDGKMAMTGSLTEPVFDGYLAFDSTYVTVGMLRQDYKFAPDEIPVEKSVMHFNDFTVNGANENPLTVNGNIDLSSLSDPKVDLHLQATDMMIINTQRSRNAQAYGKGYITLDARARGSLDFLRVNADLTLLSGTNVTYVLAGSTNSVTSLVSGNSNMVKFVNFNDTTQVEQADSLKRTSAMILDANLTVEDGAIINVDLSSDSKNKVQIQGQGMFNFSMSPLNDGRLTGRYTISKGFVRYTPPLMSEKLFDFVDGSYVSFNGDIMNPMLNLHAVDRLKTNVTQQGQDSRIVNFDVSVAVTNSLSNMNIAFDLSTQDDITVANELSGMSPDQRASQAMNLLLYNVYTGPGTQASSSLGGNLLTSFLQARVNSVLASAIPGIDLSLGMEQYDRTRNGTTSTTTAYTYRISKSLFNDRFKIIVGGNYDTNANANENFTQNIFNDISLEYMINRQGTMLIKVFRHTGFESILEGEITQTGVGFVFKRKLNTLRDFFRTEKQIQEANSRKTDEESK